MALFSCPKCTWRVKITDADLGKKGKCAQCGHELVFPKSLIKEVPALPEKPPPAPVPPSAAQSLSWLKWLAVAAAVVLISAISFGIWLGLRGSPKAIVFGKVTYQNIPLSSGTISFLGDDGFSKVSIDRDGSYQIADAPLGAVKVSVHNRSTFLEPKGEKIKWVVKSLIPSKYNDFQKSGLSYTISTGRQEINIDLKD
jgi:hypothetical protein